jgi:hypothetical protein
LRHQVVVVFAKNDEAAEEAHDARQTATDGPRSGGDNGSPLGRAGGSNDQHDTAQQFIAVGAGSPNIDGSASFPVTGPVGSEIVWEVQYFGQTVVFGGSSVSEVCRPTTPVTVPNTRIERSFLSRFPALARLAEHICNNPRSHFRAFAFLCALRAG